MTGTKPVDIVFTADQAARLRAHLFQENQDEQAAYAFVSPADSDECLRLLVHHLVTLGPDAFLEQNATYLEVKPEIAVQIAQHALEGDFGLVEIHSHPFADEGVAFSATDTDYALPRFRWFAEQIAQASGRAFHHVMLVYGVSSADAFYYSRADDAVQPVRRLLVLESPLHVTPIADAEASPAVAAPDETGYAERTSRQIAAFGAEGQQRLSQVKVGIVGVGGIGGLVAQQLALLGVRRFVLVDADTLEVTNLNRFIGATLADAEAKRLKVEVVARAIQSIDPGAKTASFAEAFPTAAALAALKDVDVLFGCTDTHGSRLIL
ncbi:MAG: ThiF family adenylyltransferase, partial [Anaerolineae bacterium]|nr:ThiF family adenylyltransferase [Anaerolineae bacterium]